MKLKKSKRDRGEVLQVVDYVPPSRSYWGPEEPTLTLECWEDELSSAQLEAYQRADRECAAIEERLGAIVKESGGEVVFEGDRCSAYSVRGSVPDLKDLSTKTQPAQPKKKGRKEKEKEKEAPPPPPEPEVKIKEGKKLKKDKGDRGEKEKAESVQSVAVGGVRPSEATAIGGLASGVQSKNAIVDLTKDDGKNAPDSREVSFNKLQGKTFPSLVVVARPYLRSKETSGNSERAGLDSKVKSVLMHTPTKFTEWLIQQGLIRSEQTCAQHASNKLKLGMYSDVSKFPYSGGYVWISECCPARFVSVFFGSLFEGAAHPPSVLLKLIYHWACQTNVQNVVQWVKVDNLYVKSLFTWLRAACTAALHHHASLMGGPGRKIEVGVISLGTTSHDGLQRQVKVEVLGILDAEAKLVRLRAVEPLADGERNYKKRFQKILEPLAQWVSTDSVILTDLTVDKGTLLQMGFKSVHQVSNNDSSNKNSNSNVMEYLRRIVPRMFQNTLSLLSRQIIQQFLDELVWREWYGNTAGQAFDNIVLHLAEQTRLDAKDNLVVRLNKISSNPFKNWRYPSAKYNKIVPPIVIEIPKETKRGRKKKELSPEPPPPPSISPAPRKNGPGRKRKRINYIEDEVDEDVVLLETKKEKKLKKKQEEEEEYEVKREIRKKPEKKKEEKKVEKVVKKREKDEIKTSLKKDIKEDLTVDLDLYYFGELQGNECPSEGPVSIECTECGADFDNAVVLQAHMLTHACYPAESENAICRYCLHVGGDSLTEHVSEFHPIVAKPQDISTYACLICDTRCNSLSILSSHMQKMHTQLELPYSCGVCGYRVSSQRLCIDHFYKEHAESASLQCPLCLKVIKVYADGCDLRINVQFFYQHLLNHMKETSPKLKCNRCSLKFVHLGSLKDHQVRHHVTVAEATPINQQGLSIHKPKNKATPPVKDSTNHIFVDVFEKTSLCIPDGFICKECDSLLEDEKHFLGTYKCTKCIYQTSCWKSLLNHSSTCQESKLRGQQSAPLAMTMHCICSFSSSDGNMLAQHLAQCDRQSAYPTEEQAKANTIAICPTKQSMMDSLCLQRNRDVEYTPIPPQPETLNDYPAPSSVLNTQLSLDDLAPPSVLQSDQMEIEQLKNEVYEQPLATPQVQHHDLEADAPEMSSEPPQTMADEPAAMASQVLDSLMDGAGEFEPLPAEPMPQPEFEPL